MKTLGFKNRLCRDYIKGSAHPALFEVGHLKMSSRNNNVSYIAHYQPKTINEKKCTYHLILVDITIYKSEFKTLNVMKDLDCQLELGIVEVSHCQGDLSIHIIILIYHVSN